jgi:hypothetical protein
VGTAGPGNQVIHLEYESLLTLPLLSVARAAKEFDPSASVTSNWKRPAASAVVVAFTVPPEAGEINSTTESAAALLPVNCTVRCEVGDFGQSSNGW